MFRRMNFCCFHQARRKRMKRHLCQLSIGLCVATAVVLGGVVMSVAQKGADTKEAVRQKKQPDVIFVPTPQPVVDRMLALAQVKKGETVYDLGCGDGRIVVTAAKQFGAKGKGFDIDPKRIAESQENVKKN